MIICFRCTAEAKANLDHLVASGLYRDYDEAISAAVRNQVLMEKEVGDSGAIILGSLPAVSSKPAQPNGRASDPTVLPHEKSHREKRSKDGIPPRQETLATSAVPPLFQFEGLPQEPPEELAELPGDMWAHGQMVPLDRWILGQYNRLLPAKANSRALIRLFMDGRKGLNIGETASTIASQATLLGNFLRQLDARLNPTRDDALATAFPTQGKDSEKSQARYANQFVAYQNSKGELSGLMVDLKLGNVLDQRKERLLVPTQFAWEFARLPNPVLDGAVGEPKERFSHEERTLLLRHIASSVPAEAFAYRAILQAVQKGHNTPETIDASLRSYLSEDRVDKLSQSFLASQRSGAVSRMSDLGLIARQREGVRVAYSLTEDGKSFLEGHMQHKE